MTFYPNNHVVPAELRTERVWLRPLRTTDVELDYAAVMESAAQLRRWSLSDWPADDFTLADNCADLDEHQREHEDRVAFTYTVLSPSGDRCLGCVYMASPSPKIADLHAGATLPVAVRFWARTSELANDLDRHLFAALRTWLAEAWAFDRVIFTTSPEDERQLALFAEAALLPGGTFLRHGTPRIAFT